MNERSRRSSFWGRARKLLPVALGLIAFAAIANYAPSLANYSDQDDCAFGPVSKEQYQKYFREVELRQRTRWPPLNSNARELQSQLNDRFRDMAGKESSVYARMAIMHAILRGIGAFYINTNGIPEADPDAVSKRRNGNIQVAYLVETNRLAWFQLYPRRLSIVAYLPDVQGTSPEILRTYGGDRFLVNPELHLIERLPANWTVRSGQSCPSVPAADIAKRYEERS